MRSPTEGGGGPHGPVPPVRASRRVVGPGSAVLYPLSPDVSAAATSAACDRCAAANHPPGRRDVADSEVVRPAQQQPVEFPPLFLFSFPIISRIAAIASAAWPARLPVGRPARPPEWISRVAWASPLPRAIVITPVGPKDCGRSYYLGQPAFPFRTEGRPHDSRFSGPARRSLALWPAGSLSYPR